MNDTPITDANRLPDFDRGGDVVLADVAAELERELTAARKEIEGFHFALKQASTIYDAVTEQRDRLAELLATSLKYIHTCPFKANCITLLRSLTPNEP
jgi:protein required for attachment to host cells